MANSKWHGIDASKEISLFEYGLLVKELSKDSYEVIYGIVSDGDTYTKFDTATITNIELNYLTKESWFSSKGFFSFVGMEANKWYESYFPSKLHDLIMYYGYENIFGTSYYGGLTTEEIKAKIKVN